MWWRLLRMRVIVPGVAVTRSWRTRWRYGRRMMLWLVAGVAAMGVLILAFLGLGAWVLHVLDGIDDDELG